MPAALRPTAGRSATDDGPAAVPWRVHVPAVTIDPHVNTEFHLLMWQVRGRTAFVVGGETRSVLVGHALWVPSGERHGFTTDPDSVVLPLFFAVDDTATTLDRVTSITVDRDLRTLFLAYIQTTYTIIRPPIDIARQILSLIEDRPVVSTQVPLPTTDPALTVAEALRFNPGDDRSVHQLAAAAHSSARTLERGFLAETGMTLRSWRIANRMETAGVLLRAPTTIDAVAHRVGYTHAGAFRRVFKAHFGIAPSEYIERFRSQ